MTPSQSQPNVDGITAAFEGLGIHPLGYSGSIDNENDLLRRRQAFFRRQQSPYAQLSLVRGPDGVLRWYEGAPGSLTRRPGRASRAAVPAGRIEQQFVFEKLHDSSQVSAAIEALDAKLTDSKRRDLWRYTSSGFVQLAPGKAGTFAKKNILLFIHGTFSHCDKIFEDLQETAEGRAFLTNALKKYDLVLAFNHPTLGVSPAVNAFVLASHLRDINGPPAKVDVICHSRGGLVTRWWLEGFADPRSKYRALFVASPLGGTNLAAPPRIKGAFDFLTNVAQALGTGATMTGFPIMQFVGGMMKVLSSVARVAIHSPALDAAVAAVPGLAAQSRVSNNLELRAFRSAGAWASQSYFAVSADYRPGSLEKWKFWNVFCDPTRLGLAWADEASDLVFVEREKEGEPLKLSPNDLVVDCSSMTELSDSAKSAVFKDHLHIRQSSEVMHTNYFMQKRVLDFISKAFGW